MALRRAWLLVVIPLVFLGLIFALAYFHDPYFYVNQKKLFLLAKEAEERGDLPLALNLARRSWERDPTHSDSGTYLGWLYLKRGTLEPALNIFQQVWKQDPKAVFALKGLAQVHLQQGKRQEALKLLADYLQRQPDDKEILLFAAQTAGQQEEDRPLAVEYYQRLYRLDPTPETRRTLVDLLSALQRFQEAIPLQEEEAALNPDRPEALHRLALLHYWQRDYEAATGVYQRLLAKAGENQKYREEAAQAAGAAQNPDEALKHYLWLYARSKGKKDYALPLARLWSQKGKHGEAAAVLAPLMDEHPDPETVRWYALELILSDDLDQAYKVYRKAWEGGDTHKETIINLARLYGRKKQFSRAAKMWDEAGRRQLIQAELRWEAALAYSYAQRFADAVEILKPVERENPKYPRLLLFLGQMHFYQKHWGLAAHYFQRYVEKHPDDLEARQLLAEALAFQPEEQDQAISQYGELAQRSGNVAVRLRRVGLLLKAKRWAEAEKELKECPVPAEAALLKEQARLLLWAGELEAALDRYQRFLKQEPRDREALVEQARVLIYLGRAPEAMEVLRRLRVGDAGALDQPGDRAVLVACIQAALAQKDYREASRYALMLYRHRFPQAHRLPRDWEEARRFARESDTKDELTLDERAWIARAACHQEEPEALRAAVDLTVANLRTKRSHHPSLLILAHVLPRLPRYEDLADLVYRIPGIKPNSPEYVAALAFFDGNLGRQGGKLDYLLHVLEEYRRHKVPDSPGELLALADLAQELGNRKAAEGYYRLAQKAKPGEPRFAQMLLQTQLSEKDWGKALASLEQQPATPENALQLARVYLVRGQYEGVKAAAARVPPDHHLYPQVQLLKVQACRLQKTYVEALAALEALANRLPRDAYLMEKARILEAQENRQALSLYDEVIKTATNPQTVRVAEARRARAAGNLAGAVRGFTLALQEAPQDVELLNELEDVRLRQRPQMASRGFPSPRGERSPEEGMRPWQFSRPDREVFGGLPKPREIPVSQPESLWFQDSNRLYGWLVRATMGFWLNKQVPVQIALEYRNYEQNRFSQEQKFHNFGLDQVYAQKTENRARLQRADLTVGAGPVHLGDALKISGEIIFRRYWSRLDQDIVQKGAKWIGYDPRILVFQTEFWRTTQKEARDRLLGGLQLEYTLGTKTDLSLKYSRRDLFDIDGYLYPRLYQTVNNLGDVRLVTLHQVDFGFSHHFTPTLTWQGNVAGAFFSDDNRRLTLYQGLHWQAYKTNRMQLEITPHYYLTAYQDQHPAYFSPHSYNAVGVTVDFHRKFYRLPTLILQGSVQAVGQHGNWGPALHGLAALEYEPVQNFFLNPHVFYFREWVDNYRMFVVGLSLRYVF
jgi:tetratricopeptide (TPR) repeat protein